MLNDRTLKAHSISSSSFGRHYIVEWTHIIIKPHHILATASLRRTSINPRSLSMAIWKRQNNSFAVHLWMSADFERVLGSIHFRILGRYQRHWKLPSVGFLPVLWAGFVLWNKFWILTPGMGSDPDIGEVLCECRRSPLIVAESLEEDISIGMSDSPSKFGILSDAAISRQAVSTKSHALHLGKEVEWGGSKMISTK